jgi:hypothetical protein
MDKPLKDISFNPVKMNMECPVLLSHPSITYVNMTGDGDNIIGDAAETDGHRFILLQANGMVRVLQACKGMYLYIASLLINDYHPYHAPMCFLDRCRPSHSTCISDKL